MSKVFIDTNILIYSIDPDSIRHQEAVSILKSLVLQNKEKIITPFVINEAHYFYIKTVGREEARKIVEKILDSPILKLVDLELSVKDLKNILKISHKYKLKTFDSFHAYYCKKLRIKNIATFDPDFKKISWIEIFEDKSN